jgi:Large polyvalent protein associated domain 22
MAVLDSEPVDLAAYKAIQTHNDLVLDQGQETADPDKAVRAIQLAQAAGVPPTQVLPDVENYERKVKTGLSRDLMQNSEAIQQYLNADPMATHVSSDDVAPLFDFSRFLDRLWNGPLSEEQRKKVAGKPVSLVPAGWRQGPDIFLNEPSRNLREGDIGAAIDATKHGLYGMATAIPKMLGVMEPETEIAQDLIASAKKKMDEAGWNPYIRDFLLGYASRQAGITEAVYGLSPLILTKMLKLPSWVAFLGLPVGGVVSHEVSKPLEQETGIPAEATDAALMVVGAAVGFKHLRDVRLEGTAHQKLQNMVRMVDPFAKTGKTPPYGFNELTDHLHEKAAQRAAEQVQEVMAARDKTQTVVRSPDLMTKFVNGIVGDGTVEINAQSVLKLYEGKFLEKYGPDDGLLGWIPDLEAQLARSTKDGGPIRVRADEYFGRVDKEVHKALADDFRLNPDELTPNEVKAKADLREAALTAKKPKAEEPTAKAEEAVKLPEPGQPEVPVERAEIRPENGSWAVYLDGERVKAFITRSAAEEHLAQIAPELTLEGGLKKAAGLDQVDYDLAAGDVVEIAPSPMFGRLVLKLPKAAYDRILKLRDEINEARKSRQLEKALKRVKNEQTPMWQERFNEQMEETWADMQDNPQYQIKRMFDDRTIGTHVHDENIRIDRNSLDPDMAKLIPRQWLAKKGGWKLDDIAIKLLHMDSGRTLFDHITKLERDRGTQSRTEYFLRTVSNEARARMERKWGDPAESVLAEALDHVTDDGTYGIIWEHLLATSQAAGKVLPHTKESFRDTVLEDLSNRPFSRRVLDDAHRDMGKAHKDTIIAAGKNNWDAVFEAQQQYAYNHVLAQEAKKLNARITEMDRFDSQFGKQREVPGYAVEHTDRIHDIMWRTGSEVRRGAGPAPSGMIDLDTAMRRHNETRAGKGKFAPGLKGFLEEHLEKGLPVEDHKYENDYLPNMVVYEKLYRNPDNPAQPEGWITSPDKMTIGEWTAIADTKKSIAKWGRDTWIESTTRQKMKIDDLVDAINKDLSFFPERLPEYTKLGVPKEARKSTLSMMWAELQQMEYIFDRIGRFDPNAPLMKFVHHKLVDGVNRARELEVEYSVKLNRLAELYKDIDMTEVLPNDVFYEPSKLIRNERGEPMVPANGTMFRFMTKHNAIAVAVNMGLKSGQQRVTGGYGATPEQGMAWLNQHLTKKDWGVVQGFWKLLREIKDLENERDIRMTGVTVPEEVGARLDTPFGVIRGEYYPVIHDVSDPRFKVMSDETNKYRNARVRVANGWEKARTAHDGPISLDLQDFGNHLARRLRALGVKEAVVDASHVFYNEKFQLAFASRFGKAKSDLLEPFLKDVAGRPGWETGMVQGFSRFFENFRRGTTQAIAGFSHTILLKHAPTALIHGIGEVGPQAFLEALYHTTVNNKQTMKANENFIYDGAVIDGHHWSGVKEIKGRRHQWYESAQGGVESMLNKAPTWQERQAWGLPAGMSTWKVIKQELTTAGSWAIQTADMKIAEIVFHAKYKQTMEQLAGENMTLWEAHLEAVRQSEFSIRKALGSTATTSRSSLMRNSAVFWRGMTMFMGFFNNTLMRLQSTAWRSKDAYREFSETGDGKKFAGELGVAGKDLMTYFVYTAIVEQLVEQVLHPDTRATVASSAATAVGHLAFQIFPAGKNLWGAAKYGYGFNPGLTVMDSGMDKYERLAQMAIAHPEKFLTPKGQIAAGGAALDALAAYHGIGNFQTSNWLEAAANITYGGQVPRDARHFWNLWSRGTMYDPKKRRH